MTATVPFGMPENFTTGLEFSWTFLRSRNFLGNLTTFSWSYDRDPGIFREFDNFFLVLRPGSGNFQGICFYDRILEFTGIFASMTGIFLDFYFCCPQNLRDFRGYPCALAHTEGAGMPAHPRVPE